MTSNEEHLIALGERYEALLEYKAFDEAFRELGESYNSQWFNTNMDDKDVREELWQRLKVMQDLKKLLSTRVLQKNRLLATKPT
jgi:hypothetical protein